MVDGRTMNDGRTPEHVYTISTPREPYCSGGIMQTCPCDVDPLTPHFYIVKLGFTGVYIIFLFLL